MYQGLPRTVRCPCGWGTGVRCVSVVGNPCAARRCPVCGDGWGRVPSSRFPTSPRPTGHRPCRTGNRRPANGTGEQGRPATGRQGARIPPWGVGPFIYTTCTGILQENRRPDGVFQPFLKPTPRHSGRLAGTPRSHQGPQDILNTCGSTLDRPDKRGRTSPWFCRTGWLGFVRLTCDAGHSGFWQKTTVFV